MSGLTWCGYHKAFIVKDGDYVAIGSTTEIQKAAPGYNAALVDLHGAFVMSALHDAHTHLLVSLCDSLYSHRRYALTFAAWQIGSMQ